jgi:hypothetical protein
MIIAGTGVGGFLDQWFVDLNGRMFTTGIDNLNEHTPGNLAAIWAKTRAIAGNAPTTTVYHFGFSEVTGLIHSYAYRSENGFKGERLAYRFAAKPECTLPSPYTLPDDIRGLMEEQRKIQAAIPRKQRIHIGGEIQIHHLTKDGYRVFTHHRFEDYAQDQKTILSRFK